MKFTTKLFLTWISIFLIFYLAVIGIIYILWGLKIDVWQLAIVFIIAGVIPPAIITALFYKKLEYMESEDSSPPLFKGRTELIILFNSRSTDSFNEILQRIDKEFIVSYSDKNNSLVKFRTDSRILSWGVCGYVKLLDDSKVCAIVYPMNGNSVKEDRLVNQTLSILSAILSR